MSPLKKRIFFFFVLGFCLLILTRFFIANKFSVLSGDSHDAVIVATILEHWYRFFQGIGEWSRVSYFYPYKNTIAQTDAYFLLGVFYSPFRYLGLDQFLSIEMVNLVLKTIGFVSAFVFARKVFGFGYYWSLLVSVLFTLSNGMTIHNQRVQLATVAFFPLMALLLYITIQSLMQNNMRRFITSGVVFGILYGAWCMTCFYMAWFFLYFTAILILSLFYLQGRETVALTIGRIRSHWREVALVMGCAILSLTPFIVTFLPKSFEVGVRSVSSALGNTVPLTGIVQVGTDNILFGTWYNHLLSYLIPNYKPGGEYYNTGFNVALFFVFLCGAHLVIKRPKNSASDIKLRALVVGTLISWFFTLKFFGVSFWFFVYYLFPGAKALNVVAIYQIFLALPVLIVAVFYLQNEKLPRAILGFIVALLIFGELNRPYIQLDRKQELKRVEMPSAPSACHSFYVSGWAQQQNSSGPEWAYSVYPHMFLLCLLRRKLGSPP